MKSLYIYWDEEILKPKLYHLMNHFMEFVLAVYVSFTDNKFAAKG